MPVDSGFPNLEYRKCCPSGRNTGPECAVSPRAASSTVTGVLAPPKRCVYIGHAPKQPFLSTVMEETSMTGLEVRCWACARAATEAAQRRRTENLTTHMLPCSGPPTVVVVAQKRRF